MITVSTSRPRLGPSPKPQGKPLTEEQLALLMAARCKSEGHRPRLPELPALGRQISGEEARRRIVHYCRAGHRNASTLAHNSNLDPSRCADLIRQMIAEGILIAVDTSDRRRLYVAEGVQC